MDATFFGRLPPDLQELTCDIEAAAGVDIAVEVVPAAPHLSCTITEDGARIFTPSENCLADDGVLHELLHIRRILVDGVPQLAYDDDAWPSPEEDALLKAIDNNLEHLAFCDEELARRPERRKYWVAKMRDALPALEASQVGVGGHGALALLCFAFVQHVLRDDPLMARAQAILDAAGLGEHPARLFDGVMPANQTKERTAQRFFNLLGLPTEDIRFEYIDSRAGATRRVPLVEVAVRR